MFMIMLIENDVVIEDDIDNNWYETMLVFMIILIWDDVVIDDYVDNVTEMRWYWCGEWHWDEMMLMLIMTLRWDVVDVDNVIVMMYVVYVHGDAMTKLDIPDGENRVVKEF